MEEQRKRARESSGFGTDYNELIKVDSRSDFSGYDHNEQQGTINAIFHNGQTVTELKAGEEGIIFLDKTAFYAESGGQVGDKGLLIGKDSQFEVTDTQKIWQGYWSYW
ncbi:alanyl-tRNA synthetase [Proteus mirabilis]|uniref:Alanyl-tRNA synthetase n=1 Tax=Proteus mirabilis TaxID=584 RepID=A0A2X2E490_PROMI|nr:alanyl-tRNA synthetase [Proteus mirabilis]